MAAEIQRYLDDHNDQKTEEESEGRSARLTVGAPRLRVVFDDAGSRALGPVCEERENTNHNDRDSSDQIAPAKVLGERRVQRVRSRHDRWRDSG